MLCSRHTLSAHAALLLWLWPACPSCNTCLMVAGASMAPASGHGPFVGRPDRPNCLGTVVDDVFLWCLRVHCDSHKPRCAPKSAVALRMRAPTCCPRRTAQSLPTFVCYAFRSLKTAFSLALVAIMIQAVRTRRCYRRSRVPFCAGVALATTLACVCPLSLLLHCAPPLTIRWPCACRGASSRSAHIPGPLFLPIPATHLVLRSAAATACLSVRFA